MPMSPATLAQAILGGLAAGVAYASLALPFGIVLGLARVLNLAHGELVILGGYAGYAAGQAWGWPLPALAAVAALALTPLGLLWPVLLARLREPVELNSLTLTFGLSLLLQNGILAFWSADYRLIPTVGAGFFGLSRERATIAGIGLVLFAGLHLALTRTRWGTALRATSGDPEAAALMGVDTGRVVRASFAAAAAVAGAGGAAFAGFHYLHPAAGVELTLLAVTLAILGGVGRLGGLLAAGLGVGLLEALTVAWFGPRWRELAVMLCLLGALLVRSRGLGGGREHA